MKILDNSCIKETDRIGMRIERKSYAARMQEEGRHAVCKIRGAVIVKKIVEDNKRAVS